LEPDRENGVEGGHGVLEDHRDPVAAHLPDLVARYLEQVFAIFPCAEPDLSGRDFSWRHRDQPQQRHHTDTLAAAALTYDCQGFAFIQVIGDAVDRVNNTVLGEEARLQALHLQQSTHPSPPGGPGVRFRSGEIIAQP